MPPQLSPPPRHTRYTRRALLRAAVGAVASFGALGGTGAPGASALPGVPGATARSGGAPGPAVPALAEDVRQEFLTAWTAYRRLAWGRDELRPVSGTGAEFFVGGVPLGLTLVESLDTLYLMELDGELAAAVAWIDDRLDFDRDADVHVFEAIIRLVGGLLSGHHCTGEAVLLTKARDLADRLLPAFTASPTGAPYRYVNLRTGAVRGGRVPLAELGSNATELGMLSQLTGDRRYFDAAKRALKAPYERRSGLDLVGTTLDVETGAWTDPTARVDPPVDSYFEYLWDAYQFLGDTEVLGWYRTLTSAVLRHLAETRDGRLWLRSADMRTGAPVGHRQSELTSFYAGLLAQGGNLSEGESYHASWAAALGRFRLPPEELDYVTLSATGTAYRLRPEYVDSALFLWLLTGKEVYRDRARWLWDAQQAHCKVANGCTVVTDMTTSPTTKGDLTPGYWFSENMKYFYLLWSGTPRFDYASNYLTTEGNVLHGAVRAPRAAPSGTFRLLNRATGRALEASADAVTAGPRRESAGQQWIVTTSGGCTKLTNLRNGRVLEAANATAPALGTHDGTPAQQWTLLPAAGAHRLVNRATGRALAVAGPASGAVTVRPATGDAGAREWRLERVDHGSG